MVLVRVLFPVFAVILVAVLLFTVFFGASGVGVCQIQKPLSVFKDGKGAKRFSQRTERKKSGEINALFIISVQSVNVQGVDFCECSCYTFTRRRR